LYETSTTGACPDRHSVHGHRLHNDRGGYEDTSITAFEAPLRITSYIDTSAPATRPCSAPSAGTATRATAHLSDQGRQPRVPSKPAYPAARCASAPSAEHKRYIPLTQIFVAYINAEIGYGGGLDDKPLPFFRNFYTGGPTSVRGFYPANIGPKDINGDPTGGERKLVGNLELLFPVPGMPNDKSIRMSTFVDAGLIGDTYSFDQTRASVGFAVSCVAVWPAEDELRPAGKDRARRQIAEDPVSVRAAVLGRRLAPARTG
jgi:outer membrane protein insertion porin family